jgi:hypothetical protein
VEENPRVSVVLQDVTVVEALRALQEASGIQLEPVCRTTVPPEKAITPKVGALLERMEVRGSYRWEGVRLAEALRELAGRHQLHIHSWLGRYVVGPDEEASERAPRPKIAPFEEFGVRVVPQSIIRSETRTLHLDTGAHASRRHSLSLWLVCRLTEGYIHSIAGPRDVRVTDESGVELQVRRSPVGPGYGMATRFGPYPDEQQWHFPVSDAGAGGSLLRWVEGDLYCYEQCEPLRLELSVPAAGGMVAEQAGDVRIELHPIERDRTGELVVRASLTKPPGVSVTSRHDDNGVHAELEDDSERRFEPVMVGDGGTSLAESETVQVETHFTAGETPPARVVFDLYRRERAVKRLRFRLEGIPLP